MNIDKYLITEDRYINRKKGDHINFQKNGFEWSGTIVDLNYKDTWVKLDKELLGDWKRKGKGEDPNKIKIFMVTK